MAFYFLLLIVIIAILTTSLILTGLERQIYKTLYESYAYCYGDLLKKHKDLQDKLNNLIEDIQEDEE